MPTYVLTDTKTNKTFDKFCSYSDLEKYLEENPHIKKEISAPNIVSNTVINSPSGKGMDGGMKEVFSKIADKHPSSALADRFGDNRSNKAKKVSNIAKKHGLASKTGGQNPTKEHKKKCTGYY